MVISFILTLIAAVSAMSRERAAGLWLGIMTIVSVITEFLIHATSTLNITL